jgi:hypothetical protein
MTPDDTLPFSSCSSARIRQRSHPRHRVPGWNELGAALYHHAKPRPGRRRRCGLIYQNKSSARTGSGPWTSMQRGVLLLLVGVLLCAGSAEARGVHGHVRRLEKQTELIFDRGTPPAPRTRLKRRDGHDHEHSSASQENQLGLGDQGQQIPLPHPFDTSLGNNFTTSSCPSFFNSFLTNGSFTDCLPFSLLLQVCTTSHQRYLIQY